MEEEGKTETEIEDDSNKQEIKEKRREKQQEREQQEREQQERERKIQRKRKWDQNKEQYYYPANLYFLVISTVAFPIVKHFWIKSRKNNIPFYWTIVGLMISITFSFLIFYYFLHQHVLLFPALFFAIGATLLIIFHFSNKGKTTPKKNVMHVYSFICIVLSVVTIFFIQSFWNIFTISDGSWFGICIMLIPLIICGLTIAWLARAKQADWLPHTITIFLAIGSLLSVGQLRQNVQDENKVVITILYVSFLISFIVSEQKAPFRRTKLKKNTMIAALAFSSLFPIFLIFLLVSQLFGFEFDN